MGANIAMKLTVELDMNSHAFDGDHTCEVQRILHRLADRLPRPFMVGDTVSLIDSNGDKVGVATVTE